MSPDQKDLRAAVEAVEDPRLRHRLGELGMVRDVRARRRGAEVSLVVPTEAYSSRDELTRRVEAASAAAGHERVAIDIALMEPAALADLAGRLVELGRPAPGSDGAAAAAGIEKGSIEGPGRVNRFHEKSSKTRVIGISSGKGGVGKSSVTVNLAISLARAGHDVAILDADVYGFSVPRMIGVDEPALVIDKLVVPPTAHGVRCVSMGLFVDEEQAVIWRGPMLHKALEQFLVDVHWGTPDYLLVDMPPGTGDVALSLAQFLPRAELYVVTTPQSAAQRVARRSAVMARQLKLPVRGVIENMSWFTGNDGERYELFGAGGGQALADSLGVGLLCQIPLVPALREGGDSGRPITVTDPDGAAAGAFADLAGKIANIGPVRVYRSELTVR